MKSSGVLVTLGSLVILTATQLSVFADTLTFQDGDGGAYSSTQGAYVGTIINFGNGISAKLDVHSVYDLYIYIAFLRFPDIIGDNPGQIPSGSTIESASLDLTRANASTYPGLLGLVNGAWDESTINGDNDPATSGSAGSVPAGIAGAHCVADITAAVQAWASGTENWGVRIDPGYSPTSIDQQFYSDDEPTLAYRPLLTVTFTPAPNPVAASTWGRIKALYQ